MIEPLTGAGLVEALNGLNSAMQGLSLDDAYNQNITGQYPTDDGPTIGFANWTSDTPAVSGDTSGSISTGSGATPVDAWDNYVENAPNATVSDTTGGVVSGSKVATFVYSLMEENPGTAEAVAKAVVPVAVPLEAAITAIGQAIGVSIDAANLDAETKNTLVDSYMSVSGVIYDEAKNLVTAWKDEWGRILFPKKVFDALYNTIQEMGIGGEKQLVPPSGYDWSGVTPGIIFTAWAGRDPSTGPGRYYDIQFPTFFHTEGSVNNPQLAYAWSRSSAPMTIRSNSISSPEPGETSGSWRERTYSTLVTQFTLADGSIGYLHTFSAAFNYEVPPFIFDGVERKYQGIYFLDGTVVDGGYPEGTSQSQATSYNPSTIPVAGNLATSYDPDTGILGTEPLVPIQLTEDPYNATGSTDDPTDPTDEDNPAVENPPIPLPIPDTKPSNPDVNIGNPSIIDSTLIDELVEELANTLDPQAPESSGIIPVPPLPHVIDPTTGQPYFPSIIPDSGPGFIHVYNPTPQEFVSFGTWLWVTYADATIDKILNNPFDGVIGAHELYATPNRDGRDNIRSAFLTCPTTADLVTNRYSEIDCGTVIVPEFYGNYLDYSPYSQAYIYLPFIGINEVSIDDIVGHAVNIRYRIDSYSGSCIAMIFVAKNGYQNLCYQFAGSCSVEVPMAGGSQAAIKAAEIQAEAYAKAAMTSAVGHLFGGIGSALMGSLGGALSSIGGIANDYAQAKAGVEAARVANKSSVQHSGQFGASHGAMGEKVPFIIIRNPIQVKVVNYNDDYGFPAHKRVIIGGCTGYLRVREVNVISSHATDDEKAAIEALLKNGVYVS